MIGRIHSIQSLAATDGPGVRFAVFFQGCNLRCGCCHNPDTWDIKGGREADSADLVSKAKRYKEYFGENGGITLSGGEPLLQAKFAKEIFFLCKEEGINTCLDTSGSILNGDSKELLAVTDRVLLDIKYTENQLYKRFVGCEMQRVLNFLDYLEELSIPTTLRSVIIPTLNATDEHAICLKALADSHKCVDGIELLPFRKMCEIKYSNLGIAFPFAHIPEPDSELMKRLDCAVMGSAPNPV